MNPSTPLGERRISVVTAVHPGSAPLLPAATKSLTEQRLPSGWSLEWLVQDDADAPSLDPNSLPDFASYACTGERRGPAGTRNLAAERATGDLLRNLDADDVLLPRALSQAIGRLADGCFGWHSAACDDWIPGGNPELRGAPVPELLLPTGQVAPGGVYDWYVAHGRRSWPLHCAGLTYRTALWRAHGGQPAFRRGEDVYLHAAVSEVSPGWVDQDVTWLYRRHPGQITATENTVATSAPEDVAEIRVLAMREMSRRWPQRGVA